MRKEITISGVIGEDYNVLDIIQDAQGDFEGYDIIVDSPGGAVSSGYAIAEYIQTLPNVKTIAKRVYSIATVIFLSAPNRVVGSNSVFMIHNPYGMGIEGDKTELRKIASELEDIESDLETFYQSKTGINKKVLSALMEQETFFDGDKAMTLGFATEFKEGSAVAPTNQFKAVAFYREVNQTFNDYPQQATDNARKALEFKKNHSDMSCGTRIGWTRANQLSSREGLSVDTISRISSFARFQRFANEPYVDEEGNYNCGAIMWDAWGGEAGVSWAKEKLEELNNNFNSVNQLVMAESKLKNALLELLNLKKEPVAMEEDEEVKAMDMPEEEEATAMEEDTKAMLSEEELQQISDFILPRIVEVLKPTMESLQEEALSLQNKATEKQEEASNELIALAKQIKTTWNKPQESFNAVVEEVPADPKAAMMSRIKARKTKV